MCFELLKLLFVQILIFLFSLFLCNVIVKLLQNFLSKTNYKISNKLYYILACFIIIILGVVIGKIIVISLV
jgi:uncharacterized metal-binding protein